MQDEITGFLWDTTPLYSSATDGSVERDLQEGLTRSAQFRTRWAGRINNLNMSDFLKALEEYEALQEFLVKPQMYAYMIFSADSESDLNKKLSQQASETGNECARDLLFFELEIMELDDTKFTLLIHNDSLAKYRHFLENVRKFRPYRLPEREERLLKQKNLTGAEAFTRLFDELSASFIFTFELDGEVKELTGEELTGLYHHPSAEIRERAMRTFLDRHRDEGIIYTSVFNNIALDHRQEMELRGYQDAMEPTNIGNEIPAEVVKRLMEVSEKNYHLAQDYFRLKAKLLGLPKLKNSDIYAPLAENPRSYSFEEARSLALEAYGELSDDYRSIVDRFFEERRIDVLPRPGKGGGAYCMGISPHVKPYVFLNFTGNQRDVATLVHELGHGLHFVLAARQSMINYHSPLPLAETASIFGEMLLTRLLLERETDKAAKISLLCASIEDIMATTFRQNVLTEFEKKFHDERKQGLLSATRLCDIWWEENARLYGDSVEMIDSYRWGWSYISHFIHTRFYCYSYVFGELLVLALYRRYQEEGPAFAAVIDEILGAGGSVPPVDLLRRCGIDITDADFWQRGYDVLEEFINQLKELV